MLLRLEFVVRLQSRNERRSLFRYPSFAPPDPVAPPFGHYQIRAGIAHFQAVAAGFQMRAGVVPKSLAAVPDARRQQVFPEYFAGNCSHRHRVNDDLNRDPPGELRIVGGPSGHARIREYIYTAYRAHAGYLSVDLQAEILF